MADQEDRARQERWRALSRYDPEIAPVAEMLAAYGEKWVGEFASAYFALNEDRSYLDTIAARLISEAEAEIREEASRREAEARTAWAERIGRTNSGELTNAHCLRILEMAMSLGFEIVPMANYTIQASKTGLGTSYLYSNADILRFAQIQKIEV